MSSDDYSRGLVKTGHKSHHNDRLEQTHLKQLELRQWLQSRKDLRRDETFALSLDTVHQCVEFWSARCELAEASLIESRKSGWMKWRHKYQTFGAGVMGFMRDWDPLISVVKRGGGLYGDLFFGTVSVLFVIAEYKEHSEGYLSTALSDIRDAMIGFALYKDIFACNSVLEDDLRDKMAEAYSEFATLVVDAIKYYKGGSRRRVFKVFREPLRFEESVENVKSLIAKIRLRCDDLMYRDISQIKQSNIDLTTKIDELNRMFDEERMAKIMDRWELQRLSKEQRSHELTRYYEHLKAEIDDDVDRFFDSNDRKRASFNDSTSFRSWELSTQSAMFLLVGYSEFSIATHQHYCWVSPIVVDLVRRSRESESTHAYHLLPAKGEKGLKDVILSLLSQLLPYQANKLRNESITRNLEHLYAEVIKSVKDWELDAALEKLSQYVIDLFPPSANITLLLDRLDRLNPREGDDRIALLRILARVVQTAGCVVKVFIVISGSDWKFEQTDVRDFSDVIATHRERQERINDEDDY
ncbi:hypothetical protein N0V90_011562 [Kalmusia sp. IMI 367209]|nr:hypothetical protein N0V90_011562 [Kalmusia sp. IMI 367209]